MSARRPSGEIDEGSAPTLAPGGHARAAVAGAAAEPLGLAATTASPAPGRLATGSRDGGARTGELAPGQVISHFKVIALLGRGGMGSVALAEDVDLGRRVALKLVRDDATAASAEPRLLREARAMARVEHLNVVRIYEVGHEHGRVFIAMELIVGETLTSWLTIQPRTWREILAMFEQAGDGLAAVHGAGLVHRDFKPDNVLIGADGRAKVSDLGLARVDPEAGAQTFSPSLTRTGEVVGTPAYLAPEQQYGAAVDARADQYAFCVALRDALVGSRPRPGVELRWGEVPVPVQDAVKRGLAFDATERFASMGELLAALRTAAATPVAPARPRRRSLGGVVLAAGVVLAGGITLTVVTRRGGPSSSANRAGAAPAAAAVAAAAAAAATAPAAVAAPAAAIAPAAVAAAAPAPAAVAAPAVAPRSASAAVAAAPSGRISAAPIATAPVAAPVATAPVASAAAPVAAAAPAAPAPPPSGRKPAADVTDPGHIVVMRATAAALGFEGYVPGMTEAVVESLLGREAAVARVQLAMRLRKQGKYAEGRRHALVASQAIPNVHNDPESVWHGRALFEMAMCELALGRSADAQTHAAGATVVAGGRSTGETQLVFALHLYETGNAAGAMSLMTSPAVLEHPRAAAAVAIWRAGTGL